MDSIPRFFVGKQLLRRKEDRLMLFRRKTPPACGTCERAVPMDGMYMVCRKNGIVGREYKCRRYVYDPLKRKPVRTPPVSTEGKTYSLDD